MRLIPTTGRAGFGRGLGMLTAFALSAFVPIGARADDPVLAPFRTPLGWSAFGESIIGPVLSWNQTPESTFEITLVPIGDFNVGLSRFISSDSILDTVSSTDTSKICGHPAVRAVISNAESGRITVAQAQAIDGKTFVTKYSRPAASDADAAIGRIMAAYCGAGGRVALPDGWHDDHVRILGNWLDDTPLEDIMRSGKLTNTSAISSSTSATLTLYTANRDDDLKRLANVFMSRVLDRDKHPTVTFSETTLCGLPSILVEANAVSEFGAEQTLRMSVTQSATIAYALSYRRPSTEPANGVAIASMATLCAR